MNDIRYILASASPRRKELLAHYIKNFEIIPADVDEIIDPTLPVEKEIERLAVLKASSVAARRPDSVVIAADTVVVKDGRVFGKPSDNINAAAMLKKLRNSTHIVITGVAVIYGGNTVSFTASTEVTFCDYPDELIEWYISTGEPADCAGAYAIQGMGAILASKIDGDYNNVVGLPLARLIHTLYDRKLFSLEVNT